MKAAVSDELRRLARRIEQCAWNRPGTEKGWVLAAMEQQLSFASERRVSRARRPASHASGR